MKFARKLLLFGLLTCAASELAITRTDGQAMQPTEPSPAIPTTPPGCPGASGRDARDLSRSCGVIIPPETGDPSVKPAPQEGAMPVIPPPGTPGGDPTVLPK
jgi:hypothetical protein